MVHEGEGTLEPLVRMYLTELDAWLGAIHVATPLAEMADRLPHLDEETATAA